MVDFPTEFAERMRLQLGAEWQLFKESYLVPPSISIRTHPIKQVNELYISAINGQVSWCSLGFYLNHRPNFTIDPLFHAGAYYVQDASSMFIGLTFPQTDEPLMILDLCAAPGGKSTLLASLMNENSLLVANEVIKSRVAILRENLVKWGYPNVIITSLDVEEWTKTGLKFDYVLVDAPCSGEGLWRKNPDAVNEWSTENVQFCAERQRRILTYAKQLVKAGGRLVYSTCTFSPEENEEQLDFIAEDWAFKNIPIAMKSEWGIEEFKINENFGYAFYPHKVKGEGFFCSVWENTNPVEFIEISYIHKRNSKNEAKLKKILSYLKDDEYVLEEVNNEVRAYPINTYDLLKTIEMKVGKCQGGLLLGSIKGTDFIPAHELALSTIRSNKIPSVELNKEQALRFLKKELADVNEIDNGWWLVTYEGLGLGWIKKINSRINNYLPTIYRIRMDVDYQEL